LQVVTDGEPFWLVLAESSNAGWTAQVGGATVGERQLVDGYANGWLVTPARSGTLSITLRWGPQRLVWVGFAVSALAVLACATVLWRTRRRLGLDEAGSSLCAQPLRCRTLVGPSERLGSAVVGAARSAGATARGAPPDIALVVGVVTLVGWSVPFGPLLLAGAAPVALVLAKLGDRPAVAWVAVALLAAEIGRSSGLLRAAVTARSRPHPTD
ncbi:MAG: hypothetical protein ACT452_13150, partial [Microthrixaceae bacterium]